jgi:hypothetical protein
MRLGKLAAMLAAGAALALPCLPLQASSHSDAPLIKLDPQANLTDVYAFIRVVNGVKVLNILVNTHPFCNPGDGVTYDKFSDDALYSIHITDPQTGATNIQYDFRFSPVGISGNYKNLNTILNYGLGTDVGAIKDVGDARQNYLQTYTVTRTANGIATTLHTSDNKPLMCPPANVGPRTTPCYEDINCTPDPNSPTYGKAISGATTRDGLDRYTKETVYDLSSGETVFCGSREDSFFADIPGIFDLLNPRILGTTLGQGGGGVDDFKGYNVMTYSIRIPVSSLHLGSNPVVGVYASVSRARITLRKTDSGPVQSGPWIQVNRLGNPLFNEALVALKDKDNYNRDSPVNDATRYKQYALNPEVAGLINFVYGTKFATTNRTDIAGIFIPDVLRVDTSTGAVPVPGEAGFNRLSIFGGDLTNGKPSGWPNGRRIGDDVIDIALTAIATDLRTPIGPTHPVVLVGDNVAENDQVYNVVFPYVATPWGGTFIRHDPSP